jgi:hypothetical protein
MVVKQALLQRQLPLVGAAYWSNTNATHDDFVKAFADAVSFARAARGISQVIVTTSDDIDSLTPFCQDMVSSVKVKGEELTCLIDEIRDGVFKLTIIAK